MKRLRFILILSCCLFLAVLATQAIAQDYTQWDLPEGAKARLGKGRIIGSFAYSPDSTRLAIPSSIGIWLYDMATHQELDLLTGHTEKVTSIAFSPDGRTLASGSGGFAGSEDKMRLWDVTTGEHKYTLIGHTVAFSPDGRTLASARGGEIYLWDAVTGEHKHTLTGHKYEVNGVEFSPDGKTLASGSGDQTIRLWDANTGEHKRTLTGHTDDVTSVSFSPDGRTLASGSWDDTIRLWDASTGEHKRTLTGHTSWVKSVSFSPDGRTLASGSVDETVRLWDIATGEDKRTLAGHTGSVISVTFSPDGNTLTSGSVDGTVRLWDANTGAYIRTLTGHTGRVSSVAFSPDGVILARGNDDAIHLWDVVTGEHKHTLIGHTSWIDSVAFSPDGRTLASGSGSGDKTIRLWDAVTGEHKWTLTGHTGSVRSVAFSPDGNTLASGSSDKTIRLWDIVTRERKFTRHSRGTFTSVAFSPDGRTLAGGIDVNPVFRDESIRLWDTVTGEDKRVAGSTTDVYSLSFSPDGKTLASGSSDKTIRLWDAATGEHKHTLTGHTGSVRSVVFSPDGKTLASGSGDQTIRLWDANTGEHKRTLTGHRDSVGSVAFSPYGGTLASGSSDGTVLLWELTPRGDATVSVSPSSVPSPAIGEQLTLSLNIANGENVAGYQATVGFDSTALRYVESANGDYLPAGAFFVPPVVAANRVTLGATALAGVSNGDGTLATLTFEVLDVKESTLTLSDVILTNSDGEILLSPFIKWGRIEPTAISSAAIISVTPSRVLSPAVGGQLVFNVDITGGQNVAEHQLTWEFDNTALKYLSSSQGDYLAGGVGNGDGRLITGTFEVLAVKASIVSVTGYLTASNGLRSIPTFESAEVIVPLFGDVNRDGVVNILDLILVASSFGQPVPAGGNPADVNEDGVVNIVDLVKVAGALGNTGAAPSAQPQALTMLTTTDVQRWLAQAQSLDLTDATFQRGIIFLEQLLAALTPKETVLLPNYPNPFNPETWIPYHLAHDAAVTLTMYDTKGVLVRQLDLGHQPAGYCIARAKAAYWDGRNNLGEIVGSGIYFYQLSAGDFSAMRKMVILK